MRLPSENESTLTALFVGSKEAEKVKEREEEEGGEGEGKVREGGGEEKLYSNK